MRRSFVVANSNSWFSEQALTAKFTGHDFHFIREKHHLTSEALSLINPRYVFFPHWSWRVPEQIFRRWECVVFHVAPLPYGRGGSPIQNLIQQGFQESPFHALRMEDELDAGPIYLSTKVGLGGSLGDILRELSNSAIEMIGEIIAGEPEPTAQSGQVHVFQRRSPEMSEIQRSDSPSDIYDKIRMVDFGEYPRAFIPFGDGVIRLTDARIESGRLFARAEFKSEPQDGA